MNKCDWNQIVRYALRSLTPAEEHDVESHIWECANCHVDLVTFGRQKKEWKMPDGPATPESTIQRIRAVADRMERERIGADELVDELLKEAPSRWRYIALNDQRFHKGGVVRAIIKRTESAYYSQPWRAMDLAAFAADLAIMLGDSEERWRLQVLSYRKLSSAHVGLGEHMEALGALTVAEACIGQWVDAPWQMAILNYARANVYRLIARTDEAMRLLGDAIATFRTWGDTKLVLDARMVVAMIDFGAGRYDRARNQFIELTAEMRDTGNLQMEACCCFNIGQCLLREQAYEEAVAFWARAKVLYGRCNMPTEIIRISWSIGKVQIAKGAVEDGINTLREVEIEFKELLMAAEEIRVCLDITEVLIDQYGQNNEEALRRAREVVNRAQPAGLSNECAIALAHLRRTAKDGLLDSETVRHVRDFIANYTLFPAMSFMPLRRTSD